MTERLRIVVPNLLNLKSSSLFSPNQSPKHNLAMKRLYRTVSQPDVVVDTKVGTYIQIPIIHDAPENVPEHNIQSVSSSPRILVESTVRPLPLTGAKAMVMFPTSKCSDTGAAFPKMTSLPTTTIKPSGPPKRVEDIAPDILSDDALDAPDHLILETTFVPEALRKRPSIAHLLTARAKCDKLLASMDFNDPTTFEIWNERQIIDEGVAELVHKHTSVEVSKSQTCPLNTFPQSEDYQRHSQPQECSDDVKSYSGLCGYPLEFPSLDLERSHTQVEQASGLPVQLASLEENEGTHTKQKHHLRRLSSLRYAFGSKQDELE